MTGMQFGLFGINIDACAIDPSVAVRAAVAAEAAGWESVWTGEHYVMPDPAVPGSPGPPDLPMLDPFVALANVAAHTRTLRLGTGLTVLPVHPPLILAKQVASLDRVSSGRFLFGVGVGYLEPEFQALGVPLAGRGERTDEHLDALRAIWTTAPAAYTGRHVSFAAVRAEPGPVQRPTPPVHVGGHVASSYRRAATRGHGWYGWWLDLEATERSVAALRRALDEHDRPAELGPLEISVTPPPQVDVDERTVAAYAELGVTRLILRPRRPAREDAGELVRFVEDVGSRLIAAD